VGRIAPNKRIEDIIRAFYFYHHKLNRRSRLWLVGSDVDTEIYSFELRRLVSELSLRDAVTFVGPVADSELKAFFEGSHLYLCMSEHEGFCVPLIEAMYFGVPVIAYQAGAIAETVQSGGILIESKDPARVAELMHHVLTHEGVRSELVREGKKQLERFLLPRFCERVEELIINEGAAQQYGTSVC
jgi:glycosyltransferase involved in cell wall biosynthesis